MAKKRKVRKSAERNQTGGAQVGGDQPGTDRPGGGQPAGDQTGGGAPGGGRSEGGPPGSGQPGSGPPGSGQPSGEPRSPRGVALDWAKTLGAALILFLVLRTFLLQTFVITSSSMEETLMVGDFLILSKLAYGPRIPATRLHLPGYATPERGHIVVFRPPHDPDLDVVKRIVGMPGDTLTMRSKVLHVDGQPLDEPYTRHLDPGGDAGHRWMRWQCGEPVDLGPDISGAFRVPPGGPEAPDACRPSRDHWGPVVVPPGHFFMLGDNRDDSVDSRYWGFLDGERVRGQALVIYYSYDAELRRPFAFIRNIRPGRLGTVIR